MSDDSGKTGFDDLARLQESFWQEWLNTARDVGGQTPKPWREAVDAWSAWLPGHQAQAGAGSASGDVFQSFMRQGETFLDLCERAAQGAAADQADWLDRWLESMEQAASAFPAGLMTDEGPAAAFSRYAEQANALLNAPPLGLNRLQVRDQQALGQAVQDWQQANTRFNRVLADLPQTTTRKLRDRLTAGDVPGREVRSLRGLYDLWIDAAEEAFAELAFSTAFRRAYGELVNAGMRCRQAVTRVAEPLQRAMGTPTASDVSALARQVHALRREVAALKAERAPGGAQGTPRKKASRKKAVGKKASPKKASTKKASGKKTAAKKAPRKKATRKTGAGKRGAS